MSDFMSSNAPLGTLDPYRRVRYSTGLVLGLDEFQQHDLYFLEKNRLHNRSLHGYGTICGLDVSVGTGSGAGPVVIVSAGLAVDLQGREIRVPQDQCARLNDWLRRNEAGVAAQLGSPAEATSPTQLSLYVVLCYRECETDKVPIPSGPCQSFDKILAPSRIADDFELSLRLEPPPQVEEHAIRALGALLRQIEIAAGPGPLLTLEELENLVRSLATPGSPDIFSPPMTGSPPGPVYRLHPDDAPEFLRAAFRVWVTDVRPHLLPEGRNCASGPPSEECVLLARLEVPIEEIASGFRVVGEVTIDETNRPYLLQTRLLQEWLLNTRMAAGVTVHSELDGLDADDHPQYLLVDPTSRALLMDLNAAGNRVTNLDDANGVGDAVPFQQAIKVSDAAGGDLGDTYPNPIVVGLQKNPVAAAAPNLNDVLTWGGAAWTPQPVPIGALPVVERELTRITHLSWRHGALSSFLFFLDEEPVNGFVIAFNNNVLVRPGSADENTVQAFIELPNDSFIDIRRLAAQAVIPVDPEPDAGGLITKAAQISGIAAPAVALIFRAEAAERLGGIVPRPWVHILLRGDLVLDVNGNAIDAEHLRGRLPSGDRPAGSDFGIQGGRFESWARFRHDNDPIDLNFAAVEDLMGLPHITPTIAQAIVQRRERDGRFTAIDQLENIDGIGRRTLKRISPLVEIVEVR